MKNKTNKTYKVLKTGSLKKIKGGNTEVDSADVVIIDTHEV